MENGLGEVKSSGRKKLRSPRRMAALTEVGETREGVYNEDSDQVRKNFSHQVSEACSWCTRSQSMKRKCLTILEKRPG